MIAIFSMIVDNDVKLFQKTKYNQEILHHRINLSQLRDMIQFGSYVHLLINNKGGFH